LLCKVVISGSDPLLWAAGEVSCCDQLLFQLFPLMQEERRDPEAQGVPYELQGCWHRVRVGSPSQVNKMNNRNARYLRNYSAGNRFCVQVRVSRGIRMWGEHVASGLHPALLQVFLLYREWGIVTTQKSVQQKFGLTTLCRIKLF
jgi:hypothetical protein